jgi:hypothetical protein
MLDSRYHYLNLIFVKIKENDLVKNIFLFQIKNLNIEKKSNTILVNDYEVTTKISQYYLDTNTPLTRNSNTYCLKTGFASYIFDIMKYILTALNYKQIYSNGEYLIETMFVTHTLNELIELFDEEFLNNNNDNPIDNIKEIIDGLLTDTFNSDKYKYLTIPSDGSFRLSIKTFENVNQYSNNGLEIINDEYIETNTNINNNIYSEELFNTNINYSDSDEEKSDLNTNE